MHPALFLLLLEGDGDVIEVYAPFYSVAGQSWTSGSDKGQPWQAGSIAAQSHTAGSDEGQYV
jgi:hypothetical protein